ncbi:DUF6779 domain-containing protein [Mycobacterium canetti]|uniref:DUF6779 domain-containing protein n=1 Tax=Mycobacterium canetti TaxID=78331 RepID=UPI0002A561CA|nr:DUF6779 domain-containing protein [Mycobacterium canetti]CCK61744.1 Conserved membrane protein of unknown function, rich in alanine, arginine and proline [Mycobacterium canettii CIPT 140070010]
MTVLSRGARVRRGGRRPGWVLLTALLVLAIGASSALVFTNRVELLKLAVLLALWAAVAGAFVSVLYRRQSDADQARVRDLKLVYDLQLDREISARREYELTLESQLRRELASELRANAADEVAALRAELAALRTSLEILFDADLEHRPALGTVQKEAGTARALDGESPPADWVSSDRVMAVRGGDGAGRTDEASIIDVPEVGVPPTSGGPRHYEAPPPPQPEPLFEPSHRPPPLPPQQEPPVWQPVTSHGQWLPAATPGSQWASVEPESTPAAPPPGRRRRARHASPADHAYSPVEVAPQYGEYSRRSRHSAEHRDRDVGGPDVTAGTGMGEPAPPPRMAPSPPAEPTPRHRTADTPPDDSGGLHARDPLSGGQSVADLMARLQVESTGGGRRRRRGE